MEDLVVLCFDGQSPELSLQSLSIAQFFFLKGAPCSWVSNEIQTDNYHVFHLCSFLSFFFAVGGGKRHTHVLVFQGVRLGLKSFTGSVASANEGPRLVEFLVSKWARWLV